MAAPANNSIIVIRVPLLVLRQQLLAGASVYQLGPLFDRKKRGCAGRATVAETTLFHIFWNN
jgi:hypothetical protein